MWGISMLLAVAALLFDLLMLVEYLKEIEREPYEKYLAKKDRRRIKRWQMHCRKSRGL